ncbi:hypothetical protein J2X71_007452 [Rhizobium sp. 1399]|nr:hypothetical protein [Rhizobium sp. 1399]
MINRSLRNDVSRQGGEAAPAEQAGSLRAPPFSMPRKA